ncbi:unnamed protein product [Penicillium salamii]|nr:unnamed protein product [Penicillium salamii]CAG8269558.1 unnamed protein product [Penicillium salamii]
MKLSKISILFTATEAVKALPSYGNAIDDNQNLTVALVRSAPPNWPLPLLSYNWTGIKINITESVDQGIHLIDDASNNGAGMIVFPELWFPGFPKGNSVNNWTQTHLPSYIENSLVVGDANWKRLVDAVKKAGIYAGLAFSERLDDHIYMAQSLISPLGDVLIHRHKLRPSGSERSFFSDGTMDELQVVTTARGRVGMLECGEHSYPSLTFIMQAQMENIHIGPFPYLADYGDPEAAGWEGATVEVAASRHYAFMTGSYELMPAVGFAAAFEPSGNMIAQINASVSFEEHPIVYASINTTTFNTSQTYDVDSQMSWAVLQQIVKGYPDYIPRVEGSLVPHKEVSAHWLQTGALKYQEDGSYN